MLLFLLKADYSFFKMEYCRAIMNDLSMHLSMSQHEDGTIIPPIQQIAAITNDPLNYQWTKPSFILQTHLFKI